MQKTKLFFAVFLAHIALINLAFSLPVLAEGQNIVIRKTSESSNNPGAPRVPAATHIEAFYDSELLSVCAFFTNAGDEVDVEIENLDTGDAVNYSVAGSGGAVLPISGNAGVWAITITLSNGCEYVGEFII